MTTAITDDIQRALEIDAKEAAVYLAALSTAGRSVQAIAETAQVERTGTYDVLERLARRGLLRLERVGKRTVIRLESPERLRETAHKKVAQMDAVLPRLLQLYGATVDNFSVDRAVGEAGFELVARTIVGGTEPLRLTVGSVGLADSAPDQEALMTLTPLLADRQTQVLVASALSPAGHRWVEALVAMLPCRRLPSPALMPSTQLIGSDTVVTVSEETGGITATKVTSPTLARHERALFGALWRVSKPMK